MSTPQPPSAFSVWQVVIIEDSPEDRAEIRRLLLKGSDRRYHFIEAGTGDGGVRAILDAPGGPPDCVVLDYALPDMDALEVLAAVTGPNGLAVCPLVVLTGSVDPQHGPAVLRAGAQDFIGKDWMSAPSLTRVMENAVERWAMTCALQARTAALQTSEAELQLAMEVAGLGVNRIDYATGTVVLDATAAALFGVAAGVPLSRSVIHATFHPDDHDEIIRRMHQSLDPAGEGSFSMEHRVIQPDGSVRWLSVKKQVLFARTAAGIRSPVSSVLAAADITDRKVREMELRASEELNRSLMDGSVDCVKVLDLQGRVLNINTPGLCAMEIDDIGTVCGLEWDSIWPAGAQRDIERSVTRAAGGEVSFFQAYCPTAKGTPKWWEVTVSPVRDAEGGKVVRLLAVSRDITQRKQEEAALAEAQERQHFSLRAANAGAWDWDIGSGVVTWSPENYALYDMDPTREAPSYAQWESRVHPDDLAHANDLMRAMVEGKTPEFHAEFRVVHKNGTIVWLLGLGRAHRDTSGAAIYVSGLNIYITQRKQTENALQIRETFISGVLGSITDGFFSLDREWRFTFVNDQMVKRFGLEREAILGKHVWQLFPDAVGNEAYVQLHRAMTERTTVEYEVFHPPWQQWLADKAFPTGDGGLAVYSQDVTTIKLAAQQLSQSEARFRSLVAATTQIVWTSTADGRVAEDSPTWRAFTGQTEAQRLGWGWANAIHPNDLETITASWQHALATTTPLTAEYRLRRHDGAYRYTTVNGIPLLDESGTLVGWIGTNTDITEKKRDEEKLQQLAAELSQASHCKDEFLATLAHELRNPLAPIRNGLQLLKRAGGQQTTVERVHDMMERQLTQMVRLIDDLMDVSRISQGKLELRKERLSLETVLNSAVETSRPLIDKMGHQLTVTTPRQPIMVDADMTRLAQVFLNLLNNAVKYSERDGQIRVDIERQGSDAVVTVKDTGIGMAADQLPRIFDMFTQVDRSLEKSQGGLSIGLTLVKRLIEMHGGSVEARSEGPGMGSEFVVRLPLLVEASPLQAPGGEDPPEDTMTSLRILIVDDNRDGADTLSEMLNLMGNHTRTAYDGEQAVDMAGEYRTDVVLLDIGLPKLNGYEACRRIREQPWCGNAVLVAVTGWGQDNDRRRSQEAGFHHHLVKPVDPHDLMTMLARVQTDRDAGAPFAATSPAA